MNILDVSKQLSELSDDYFKQRIALDEYRLKRKHLLDSIDKTLNNKSYEDILKKPEEMTEFNVVER